MKKTKPDTVKLLSMPKPDFDTWMEYSRETLNMCTSPSSSQGLLVELIRDTKYYKKGRQGIARPFNPYDIYNLIEKYNKEMDWIIQGLPNLSNAFDFFPYVTKDGKKVVGVGHSHITRFDFKIISTKKYKKMKPIQLELGL